MSYLLITNPFSKRGLKDREISLVSDIFRRRGEILDVVRTLSSNDGIKAVAERGRGKKAVIAAGGDGTIGDVLTGLDGAHTPIGILPRGTANVLAAELGIPHNLRKATDVILGGRKKYIDTGFAGDKRFVLMASAGFDAQIVHDAHARRGQRFGYLSYIMPIVRTLVKGDFPEIKVTIHDIEYTCRHVIVANVPRYGGPFRPAPAAINNDGELDVVMYMRKGRRNMLRYGCMAVCGSRWENDADVLRIRATRVTLESEEAVPLQCDGDPAGNLPCHCRVVRDGAIILVP